MRRLSPLLVFLFMCSSCDLKSSKPFVDTTLPANTHKAASASFSDVSAAISAAPSGDTVLVPAGSATWSDQLVITKGIQLIGAGIGQTVITSDFTASGSIFANSFFSDRLCPGLERSVPPLRVFVRFQQEM